MLRLFFSFLAFFLLGSTAAQIPDQELPEIAVTEKRPDTEVYFKQLLERHDLLQAAELALERYGCEREEYSARLLRHLATEARLQQDFGKAEQLYLRILNDSFQLHAYYEGLVLLQERLNALVGLREIRQQQGRHDRALHFHQLYESLFYEHFSEQAKSNQQQFAKTRAELLAAQGQWEAALQCLAPYALGHAYGGVDQELVDALVQLLSQKYSAKEYRKGLRQLDHYLRYEASEKQFYLDFHDTALPLRPVRFDYPQLIEAGQATVGEAKAYYLRQLRNSYFYAALQAKA